MAKKKTVPLLDVEAQVRESEREAARERAERKRRGNAEKQARFRKSMKEQGYREVKFWKKSTPPGMVKPWKEGAAPLIKETSVGVCEKDEKTKEAVKAMMDAFIASLRGGDYTKEVSQEVWGVREDIIALLSPLGYKSEI